jgi:plastocyanin
MIAAALLALAAGVALAAGQTITTSATSDSFSQASFAIDQGDVASLQNTSVQNTHNVTAQDNGPDGKKLFRTPDTDPGNTAPVNGTQYLAQGQYHFVCTIHAGMEANLTVTGNGTPVARPDIELKVLSSKLDKVRASRRLKVKVTAPTESKDVALVARKGARKLASKSGIDIAAGSSKTLRLKLTGSGRKALELLQKAKVKVTGTVPFGSPDSARRTLR